LLIRFKSYRKSAPNDAVLGLISAVSFVMSVFWIWLFANILIDLLKVLGLLTGLPTTFLGLTVLAWGNSVGDLMANTSIARKGFVEMALTGCYASPLFNILLGLGLSTIRCNLVVADGRITSTDGIRFTYRDSDSAIPITLIVGSFIGLLFTLIMTTVINKQRITKLQAKITLLIYALIITVACLKARM
jgi:sodium/potassium/calcium exchanger 6